MSNRNLLIASALALATACTTMRGVREIASSPEDSEHVKDAKAWVVDADPKVGFVTSLPEMNRLGLTKGAPRIEPWSGSYWPDRLGNIAVRYQEKDMGEKSVRMLLGTNRASKTFNRLHGRTMRDYASLSSAEIALLSPSEKYDILVGDSEFTLTRQTWKGIIQQQDLFGKIKDWSGICNGWSPVAATFPRPEKAITVTSADGRSILFYPDDIKALASTLWAHSFLPFTDEAGKPTMPMYGLRCDTRKPKRRNGTVLTLLDGEYTRAANECSNDVNPGTWHLSIVNRMGVQKQAFVIDKAYDAVVSNHPVGGYGYVYFNPDTGRTGTLGESVLALSSYARDPFREARDSRAKYVVGIVMDVDYLKNQSAAAREQDSRENDVRDVMKLHYDLELDENFRVVSGQWRMNRKQRSGFLGLAAAKPKYPDFMWYQRTWAWATDETPPGDDWVPTDRVPATWVKNSRNSANTVYTYRLDDRAGFPAVPAALSKAAKAASARYDEAWSKYGEVNANPSGYSAELVSLAQKELADVGGEFDQKMAELDAIGIPRSRPFAQPLAKIVYGLMKLSNPAMDYDPRNP